MLTNTNYGDAVIAEQFFMAMTEDKTTDARYDYFAWVGCAYTGLLKDAINFGYVGV